MHFHSLSEQPYSLLDESLAQHPDMAEQTVLSAVRTWLRPQCDAVRKRESWRESLSEAGLTRDGLVSFDLLMRSIMSVSHRPLDTRCRCASDLAKDEAMLLQSIALLQGMRSDEAIRLLDDWLPQPAVSVMLKVVRWFAIALLEAGLELTVRERRVTYMH
ncbi:hypothetical protein P3T40_006186 [Paraburkholderia sp. EB58]|jgi:hypothetical protein|uniref:hypothetical protein n=1 Tax=Paraburkholderia sp. EB58 TaxID=3035125 RepID=UPI003D1DC5C6